MEKDDKAFEEILSRLAYSTSRWLQVRSLLMEEIKSNQELIVRIDKIVQNLEYEKARLN